MSIVSPKTKAVETNVQSSEVLKRDMALISSIKRHRKPKLLLFVLLVHEMVKTIMIYLYNWIIRIPHTQAITTLCQVLHQKNLTIQRFNTIIII